MNADRHAREANLSVTQLVLMLQDAYERAVTGRQPTADEVVTMRNVARQVAYHVAKTIYALSHADHVAANDSEGGNHD